ncbi:MAG: putative colanic acid biosynthesis glycosyltransferase [Salibacteraceae bacterium]|jgi:glycosyltransferase involved in cell wall biosynthesis
MKILQINTTVNTGSTGRITEEIGRVFIEHGHESYIAYGRGDENFSKSQLTRIGTKWSSYGHGIKTLLLDRHGFGSEYATKQLIIEIKKINPDVIGLHNLHGYYLNIEVLFKFLESINKPIVWTLFDCWAFTGHCTYYDNIQCKKWKSECHQCPKISSYPRSLGVDQSRNNFKDKKALFNLPKKMKIVVHSRWLKSQVELSFLKNQSIDHIFNGTNLQLFKPYPLIEKKIILGVASTWDERKGLKDFVKLNVLLEDSYQIVLIGLNKKQIDALPDGILGISRTENIEELVEWYNKASVFVNPTYQDNFPTTNIEALACGTPVITYDTGGSPEAIDVETGVVVKKKDIEGIVNAISFLRKKNVKQLSLNCRKRAEAFFDKNERYQDYLNLYKELLNGE